MQKIISIFKNNKWLFLILIIATFLRFYHLDFQSLWMDELYTMVVSNPAMSWTAFHKELIAREGFPHLYFIILKIFYFLFGFTSIAARSVSTLAGIAGIYALYLLGKTIHSKKVGLFAAALLTVNSYHIYISQDARPYTLYFLFICLSFTWLIKFLKNNSWKNALYYALFTGLLLNFNFFALINVFSQALISLLFLVLSPKENKVSFFKKSVASGLIIFVMFAINYEKFFVLMKYRKFWVAPPTSDSFSKIFQSFIGESEIIYFLILPLIIYYIFLIFRIKKIKEFNYKNLINNKLQFGFIVMFIWFFVLFSILMIKSYGQISYLLTRYFISILPILFVIFAIALKYIKNKINSYIMLFILLFFMIVNVFVVKKYYTTVTHSQYREAAAFVMKNKTENVEIYSNQAYWYKYYFNKNNTSILIQNLSLDKVRQKFIKTPNEMKSFWYIDAYKRFDSVNKPTQEFLDKNFIVKKQFKGYRAWAMYYELKK